MMDGLSPEDFKKELVELKRRYKENKVSFRASFFNYDNRITNAITALIDVISKYEPKAIADVLFSNSPDTPKEDKKQILEAFSNDLLYRGPAYELISQYKQSLSQQKLRDDALDAVKTILG